MLYDLIYIELLKTQSIVRNALERGGRKENGRIMKGYKETFRSDDRVYYWILVMVSMGVYLCQN